MSWTTHELARFMLQRPDVPVVVESPTCSSSQVNVSNADSADITYMKKFKDELGFEYYICNPDEKPTKEHTEVFFIYG